VRAADWSPVSAPASLCRVCLRLPLVLLALTVLCLLSAPASADTRIGTSGPGLNQVAALALSKEQGGAVYVLDGSSNQRISEFGSNGAFIRAFGWGIVPGAAQGIGDLTAGNVIANVKTTSGAFLTGQPISGAGIPAGTRITGVGSSEITLSQNAESNATSVALTVSAGPGNVPTNELQKLTVSATGGQFKLTFTSPRPGSTTDTTAPLAVNAGESRPTASEVQAALEALPNVGPGNVSVSGGPADAEGTHPYLVEFTGRYADVNVRQMLPEDLTLSGGSASSELSIVTPRQGAGAVETCTTVCRGETVGEGEDTGQGSAPGQLRWADEIAIDNELEGGSNPSYGDVYVVDQRNFRVEKYDPEGHFLLMFGGEVDKTTRANICSTANLAAGDSCGRGVPGTEDAHFYAEDPSQQTGGEKSWFWEGSNSIAVGPGGKVYVGDFGRIQEFDTEGHFLGEFVLPDPEKRFVSALAADPFGNLYERSTTYAYGGSPLTSQVPGVREWSPAHILLQTFDAEAGQEPTHIALDENGDLFTSDFGGGSMPPSCQGGASPRRGECPREVFRAFKPDGSLYAVFSSPEVEMNPQGTAWNNPAGITAAASVGDLYVSARSPEGSHVAALPLPQAGAPLVEAEEAEGIEPETANLRAIVNPREFDTTYQFQWISEKRCKENETAGHECFQGAEAAPKPPADLGSVWREDPVQAAISALTPATSYRWRVLAENHCNGPSPAGPCITSPEATFETLPAVSVRDFTTQLVAPEEVTIKAEADNNNSLQAGHWKLCLGAAAGAEPGAYSLGCKEGELRAGSSSFEAIKATFTGLTPNTEYHYRLFVENFYTQPGHPEESVDQTLTTEPSAAEERQAEDCPQNGSVHGATGGSALREENNSTALPDCRAYEQVSPRDKKGGEAIGPALAASGEAVASHSFTDFGETASDPLLAEYLSQRGPGGWTTQSLISHNSPPGLQPSGFSAYTGPILSAGLDRWLYAELPGLSASSALEATDTAFLSLGASDGTYVLRASPDLTLVDGMEAPIGALLHRRFMSEDLSRVFIGTSFHLLPAPADPRPTDGGSEDTRIYEIAGVGAPAPTLSLVAEVPVGLPGNPPSGCLIDSHMPHSPRQASADGTTLLYTAPIQKVTGAPCGAGAPNPIGLFARVDGAAPIQLNAPPPSQCSLPSPCASAGPATPLYAGMSPDGSRAWFITTQPLIAADLDQGSDLYLAKLEGGQLSKLVLVSGAQNADVLGVSEISPDGSHAAFVATGVLTTAPNSQGESAQQGADNLYLYDATSGETHFAARLCSGPQRSGSTPDQACPRGLSNFEDAFAQNDDRLWLPGEGGGPEVQFTPNGRYMIFTSFARLSPGDTDDAQDLYRYDFQTGQLIRLSFGRNGNDGNGNDDLFPVRISGHDASSEPLELAADKNRAISADGSVVIFHTAASLVSHDTNTGANPGCGGGGEGNTGCDIYEWEEAGHGSCDEAAGCISLISPGVEPQGTLQAAVISAKGRDIVFQTRRNVIPADSDGVGDIYDARAGGGFPPPVQLPICHAAEACHGEGTQEEPPINPITEANRHGPEGEERLKCAPGKHRVKKHGQWRCVPTKKHHHRRHHKRAAPARRSERVSK
jgi:hypothetical protein